MDKGGAGYCRGCAASYRPGMAKPYRSRIDSRNHRREANAARRNQSELSGIAAALVSAKDTAKAMLGF
jgi:hypothetical protein